MAYIRETKQISQSVTVGRKCDICGLKVVDGQSIPKGWFHFNHQHSEWGNDSIDSVEYFDVCSVACFAHQLEKSLSEMKRYERSAQIADMSYEFAEKLYEIIK